MRRCTMHRPRPLALLDGFRSRAADELTDAMTRNAATGDQDNGLEAAKQVLDGRPVQVPEVTGAPTRVVRRTDRRLPGLNHRARVGEFGSAPPRHGRLVPCYRFPVLENRHTERRLIMTRRTHVLTLVTLVLMFLMVAPTAFAAEADADRWLADIDDANGDAVPDIAVGDPAQGRIYVFSGADGTLLNTVEDPDLQAEAPP
jgi:hypothetical protein